MAEIRKLDLLSLGGGLNVGVPATHIADNEWVELQNMYPYQNKLVRRKGRRLLAPGSGGDPLSGLFPLKTSVGMWTLLVMGFSNVYRLEGNQLVALNSSDGTVIASSELPWSAVQYKDVAYLARTGAGLLRAKEDHYSQAGIDAPGTAPTLADGAAGDIPAADFFGVFTYYNTETGAESNPSPVSAKLTHAGSKKIDWSGITVSTNGQVNARRLYRTLPGQSGVYFFIGQINDNFTTTFTGDNVLAQDMSAPVSFENGLPPTGVEINEIWLERHWLSDGVDVFFSGFQLPEGFKATAVISVFPDDGHEVRALRAWGDRLVIGKTNKVHYVVGTDPSNFEVRTLSDRHGCFSHQSMVVTEGLLIWYGGDNFYISEGSSVLPLSRGVKMRSILDRIPEDRKQYVVATVMPELGLYLASVTLDSGTQNNAILVYNYKIDAWSMYTYSTQAPRYIAEVVDADFKPVVYSTFAGRVAREFDPDQNVDETSVTQTAPITVRARGKAFGFANHGLRKAARRLYLLTPSVPEMLQLELYLDGESTPSKTRSVSLNQPRAWKRYSFSRLRRLGNTIQYGFEYTGQSHLELEAISMEVVEYLRAGQAA